MALKWSDPPRQDILDLAWSNPLHNLSFKCIYSLNEGELVFNLPEQLVDHSDDVVKQPRVESLGQTVPGRDALADGVALGDHLALGGQVGEGEGAEEVVAVDAEQAGDRLQEGRVGHVTA